MIQQGDVGSKFFIVTEGELVVTQVRRINTRRKTPYKTFRARCNDSELLRFGFLGMGYGSYRRAAWRRRRWGS